MGKTSGFLYGLNIGEVKQPPVMRGLLCIPQRAIIDENATLLTDTPWQYIKVPQKEFEKLEPTLFSDLLVFAEAKLI